jgi:hypothetical protein
MPARSGPLRKLSEESADVEAERAARFVAHLSQRCDRSVHLLQRGAHRREEALARLGEPDASRRALHEHHANALFELPHRLAHRGRADAEAFAGGPEAFGLGHGDEHRHRVQVFRHREVTLTDPYTGVK